MSEESTTPDRTELVRRFHEAANRRDSEAWLALLSQDVVYRPIPIFTEVRELAVCDPGVENVPPRDWPESEPIRGSGAVWDFYIEGNQPWEDSPFQYLDVIDAGTDKVVADMRREARGKASGVSIAWRYWQVVTIRNGKMLRIEWFADRAEAFEAAGLEE